MSRHPVRHPAVRLAVLALALAAAATLSASAARADTGALDAFKVAHPSATLVHRPGDVYPSAGIDLEPAPVADHPREAADAFLARFAAAFGIDDPAGLVYRRSLAGRHLIVVEYGQRLDGVDIVGAAVKLGVRPDVPREGRAPGFAVVRFSQTLVPTVELAKVATVPTLDRARARAIALAGFAPAPEGRAPGEEDLRLELAIDGVVPAPRLVWIARFPAARRVGPYNPYVFLDAHTGQVTRIFNRVYHQEARKLVRTFLPNPGSSPGANWSDLLEDVPFERLEQIDNGQPTPHLTGNLLHVFNCPDEGQNIQVPIGGGQTLSVPLCTERQLASQDEDGHFLFEPAMDDQGDSPWSLAAGQDDHFAEASLYYHIDIFYAYMQALSASPHGALGRPFVALEEQPFRGTVNFKMPNIPGFGSGTGRQGPFDNAFFSPAGPLIPGVYSREEDSVVFGQGERVDFSYDGDVIYHEMTHAIADTLMKLAGDTVDEQGAVVAPGAINEGISDFFSSTFTNSPAMADYAGGRIGEGNTENAMRRLDNALACPTYMWGEVHQDSMHFSAALWEIREALKGDDPDPRAPDVSAAILAGVSMFSSQPGFDEAGLFVLEAIEDAYGADARVTARAKMDRHVVIGCDRSIPLRNGAQLGLGHPVLMLPTTDALGVQPAPGYLQVHIPVTDPEDDTIVVEFLASSGGGIFGGSTLSVAAVAAKDDLVRFDPAQYRRNVAAASNGVLQGTFVKQARSPVAGADAYRAVLTPIGGAAWPGPGTYHIAFLNSSQGGGMFGMGGGANMQDVRARSEPAAVPEPETEGGDGDAEVDAEPEPEPEPVCQAGETRCEGTGQVWECGSDGEWALKALCGADEACEVGASGAACVSTVEPCSAGDMMCDGETRVLSCDTEGVWLLSQICAGGEVCEQQGLVAQCVAGGDTDTDGVVNPGTRGSSGCGASPVGALALLVAAGLAARRRRG